MKYIETIFSLCYIIILWWFAVKMLMLSWDNQKSVCIISAFMFITLALGDTAHVMTRIFNWHVGVGAILVAMMINFFYLFLAEVIIEHTNSKIGAAFWCMAILLLLRLIVIALGGATWQTNQHPYPEYEIRNLLLIGIQVEVLLLLAQESDMLMDQIFVLTLISTICLIPTTFLIREFPLVGMLMIPKSITYLVMANIIYKELFREKYV